MVTRVLRVLTRANVGGPACEVQALTAADEVADTKTLLVVGELAAGEVDGLSGELPELPPDRITDQVRGVVRLHQLRRRLSPLGDRAASAMLRRLIRSFRPDVVHTHTSKAGLLGRRAAVKESVRVLAHTFHGHVLQDYFLPPVAAWLRRVEARWAARTDLLTAVSQSCVEELHGLGIGAGRIQVVPPAVDLTRYRDGATRSVAREQLELAAEVPTVAFIGRLAPVKQPLLFVELLARLTQFQGLVFGAGQLRGDMQRSAERLGVQERLRFMGAVRHLPAVLRAADVVVLCSKREGLPLVGLECAVAGVPVVGFEVPGVLDLPGLVPESLVPPADVGALARAVELAHADRLERRTQLVAGVEEIVSRHRPDHIACQLHEAYRQCLQAKHPTMQ